MHPFITPELVRSAMNYQMYRALVETLVAEGRTSGTDQKPSLIEYTKINFQRMKRVEATTELAPETVQALRSITNPMTWLVLTEAWCGDAAQIVGVIETMASCNPLLHARFLLRDEHLSIMDDFLTNGGRSIPKVIFLDLESCTVLGAWGPRPEELQALIAQWKQEHIPFEELAARAHRWYAADKTHSTQRSFITALTTALQTAGC
jgi:hypothetical protein